MAATLTIGRDRPERAENRTSGLAAYVAAQEGKGRCQRHSGGDLTTGPGRGGERDTQMKVLSCRAVGVDCDWVGKGNTVDEVMAKAKEHAKQAHGMTEIPPEMVAKAKAAIKDE